MNKKKCPLCGAVKTKKNGTRKGVQLYKCLICRHQFRSGVPLPATEMWNAYQNGKQTIRHFQQLFFVYIGRRFVGIKLQYLCKSQKKRLKRHFHTPNNWYVLLLFAP